MRLRSVIMIGAVLLAGVSGQDVSAQQAESAAVLAQKGFAEVSGWITKAAEMVPADKYTYRPVATVRTYGELVGHIADGYAYFCAQAAGKPQEWSDATEKGPKDKATLVAALRTATAGCAAAYAGAGAENLGPLLANSNHANLHYGNVITYMRMLGLTPPSS